MVEQSEVKCLPGDRVDLHDLDDYDLTEEVTSPKKQGERILQIVRRLFPKRNKRSSGKNFSKKSKKDSDAESVASTAASTLGSLSEDLGDFTIHAMSMTEDGTSPDVTPDALLKVLRVLLEYESEKYVSTESGVEIVLPDDMREEEDEPLMQRRLLESGLVQKGRDFEFVPDTVSKELNPTEEDLKQAYSQENVSHVKTGVWEVTIIDAEGNAKEDPFYIVTGVSMEDRVDTKKLRKAIFEGQSFSRKPKLEMAPTEVAQALTGYQSGTMAPICHTQRMKVFMEENIRLDKDNRILCGSGMFGKCLSISGDKFLEIANANPEGMKRCPIVQKKKGANNQTQKEKKAPPQQQKKKKKNKKQKKQNNNNVSPEVVEQPCAAEYQKEEQQILDVLEEEIEYWA